MEVRVQLMVSLVFISINQAVGSTVHDESENQDNFQNLFDSISKNSVRKSETYHKTLKRDVAREQQAFDNMRDELRITQNKNAKKKVNFSNKMNAPGKAPVMKREIMKYNFDDPAEREKSFVETFGDLLSSGVWEPLEYIYNVYNDTERLQRICSQAHEKTYQEPTGEVKYHRCDLKNILFSDPEYMPIDMDVIVYTIEGFNRADGKPSYFHVGKGMRHDCVFYLDAIDIEETTFRLGHHVCGIEI